MHSIIIPCQLPDFLLALDAKPSPRPRSPRPHSSPRATSRSSRSGTQKLRYTAYEPPPPAQPRYPSAASSTSRSTPSLDSYEDLARRLILAAMQTAGPLFSPDNACAAGLKPAAFLPTTRAEMDALGWDQCDVIIVTGTPMWITRASAWPLSAVFSRRRVSGSASSRSPIGVHSRLRSAGSATPILRDHGRQHGFHGESLHLGPSGA
jgi:hypothetical protein